MGVNGGGDGGEREIIGSLAAEEKVERYEEEKAKDGRRRKDGGWRR